jgi:arylsulfatase A-like enzyme
MLPFMWSVIAEQGQIYGNRNLGNRMDLTNEYRFSYPGYSELLVGYADSEINSNAKNPNPNTTVLEFIHNQPGFAGRVAAFASWDVFPYIINSDRSGIPVNAGFDYLAETDLTDREKFLNEMLPQIPRPWNTVRHNAFTFHYAMEYLKKENPRLVYVAFDETDEFAHSGNYEGYLNSARQFDAFVEEFWDRVQSDPAYRDKTTLLIATDHGRGTEPLDTWRHHSANIDGAEEVWMAVLGPDTPALGEVEESMQLYQNQIASTITALLGLEYKSELTVGDVIETIME